MGGAAPAGAPLLVLRVVSMVMAGRLQNIPGGPPFWMAFDVSYRTLLFVAGLAVIGMVGLSLLELLVALIQAYVFTMLTCVFISTYQHGGHEHGHGEPETVHATHGH